MKIAQKAKRSSRIPNESISDIVFLLLIFFITVSVFKQYQGLRVTLPMAKETEKVESKRKVAYIWIDKAGRISINDKIIDLRQVPALMIEKLRETPALIVSIRADKEVNYERVALVLERLKEAKAYRVNFATRRAVKGGA